MLLPTQIVLCHDAGHLAHIQAFINWPTPTQWGLPRRAPLPRPPQPGGVLNTGLAQQCQSRRALDTARATPPCCYIHRRRRHRLIYPAVCNSSSRGPTGGHADAELYVIQHTNVPLLFVAQPTGIPCHRRLASFGSRYRAPRESRSVGLNYLKILEKKSTETKTQYFI